MKLSVSSAMIILLSMIVMASCKKDNTPGNPPNPPADPFKSEKGTSLDVAATKTIGPSGGTLTSADGKLMVTVAPGTVTANTNFSIQPITSTIPSTEGDTAYRLLPEGITFAKPVTITYRYNAADLKGTTSDLLMGCYQTADGKWKAVPSALNKTNQTITLSSEHFSDWTIMSILQLKVKKPILTTLEETDIEVVGIIPGENDELALAPLTPDYNVDGFIETIEDWEVIDGGGIVGVFNETPFTATYTPVSPITHDSKAHVSVNLKGRMQINDPSLPNNMREIGQVILIAEITLVNDMYMMGSFDGEKINCSDAQAFEANGHIFINAHISTDTSVVSYLLHAVAAKPGSYPCGSLLNPGNAQASISGEVHQKPLAYVSDYIACGPPSYMAYSSGSVTIDNWGAVGTYITGSFNGPVYPQTATTCTPPGKGFSVTFRAIRAL